MDKIGGSLFRLKRSNLLLGSIIFFSATQLGLHFWPLSSLVYGVRIDYLSPTLYFLDILILLFLATRTVLSPGSDLLRRRAQRGLLPRTILKRKTWLQAKLGPPPRRGRTVLIVIPLLLTNLLFSQNPLATLSWSLHFLLYFLFLRTVLDRRPEQSSSRDAEGGRTVLFPGSDLLRRRAQRVFSRPALGGETRSDPQSAISLALTLALLFQTILAISQVSLGHSLGGPLYWLGERTVAVGSPAVALATFMGRVVLRAYGTFGHPNALAGWSVVCLLILIQISQTATPKVSKQRVVRGSDPLRKSRACRGMFSRLQNTIGRPGQTLWVITILIVLLTQSLSAALSLFGFVIPFYLLKNFKSRLSYFVLILASSIYLLNSGAFTRATDLSLSQRLILQGLSLSVIRTYPIFGTGAQASISTYSIVSPPVRLLQPDHNSFTLFLSWFGLFGVLAIIQILPCTSSAKAREKCLQTLRSLGGLLPLLLLDHYFLTSPQGLFILMLYFKLAVNYSHAQNNL